MSSPVKVDVSIVDLDLFAKAAADEGMKMREVIKDGTVVGLERGEGYQAVRVMFDEKKNAFTLHADSYHVEEFRNRVLPRYNAYQFRQKLEETNRYTFPENWMTRTSKNEIVVNGFYREA